MLEPIRETGKYRIGQIEDEALWLLQRDNSMRFQSEPQVGIDVSTTTFALFVIKVMQENHISPGDVVE